MMKKTLLQVKGLTIGYKGKTLFSDINLEIHQGDCILLCGANGSGKTTLLKALADTESKVETAMIPTRIPKVKGFTLREFINLSCHNSLYSDPDKALDLLSLSNLSDRDISTLSDGEFQKGTIAAALAKGAEIIYLDEPTAFLDAENKKKVLKVLKQLCNDTGKAIVFSSHDLHEGLNVCTKVIALGADGKLRISDSDRETIVSTIFSNE
jgi:iron complex transport system ATP-binding protein